MITLAADERASGGPPRRRPRWPVWALAGALVIAAAGGGTLALLRSAGHQTDAQNRPGGQAVPAAGTAAQSGGQPSRGTPTATGSPGSFPGAGGTGTLPAGGTAGRTVRVGPLTLTLPHGWTATAPQTVTGRTMVCLAGGGRAAGCDVWVTALTAIPQGVSLSVDTFAGLLAKEQPVCTAGRYAGSGPMETTSHAVRTLGNHPAEYRAYLKVCDRAYHLEQWTVPTWPVVQVSSTGVRPALVGGVHAIVASARFTEPDSGVRMMDAGILAGHRTDGSGTVHISLDRTIWLAGGPDNGHEENANPATYDYRVSPRVQVIDYGSLCASTTSTLGRSCPLSTVLPRIDQHLTGEVRLRFDRLGVVTGIEGEYHP